MLWFVINTDLTITTEKLMEVFATMDDDYVNRTFYGSLDHQLDLPWSKVVEIHGNYHSPSQRREAYLDLYATDHPCPSWKQVAEALHDVGLPLEADEVESTYVQGTMIMLMHSFCVHY